MSRYNRRDKNPPVYVEKSLAELRRNIQNIPDELKIRVLSNLRGDELVGVCEANPSLNNLCNDTYLWKDKLYENFGMKIDNATLNVYEIAKLLYKPVKDGELYLQIRVVPPDGGRIDQNELFDYTYDIETSMKLPKGAYFTTTVNNQILDRVYYYEISLPRENRILFYMVFLIPKIEGNIRRGDLMNITYNNIHPNVIQGISFEYKNANEIPVGWKRLIRDLDYEDGELELEFEDGSVTYL